MSRWLATFLGYVSLPEDQRTSPEERAEMGPLLPTDDFGVTGVEKTFDDHLRGKPGVTHDESQ
jgi:penicillin-binding protein 2